MASNLQGGLEEEFMAVASGTTPEVHLTAAEREALRIKYREERDKRLRPDGNQQYIEPKGRFAHFLDDPFTTKAERKPCFDDVTVGFIGGGFAGLVTGARFRQAGITDFRIIEAGGDAGSGIGIAASGSVGLYGLPVTSCTRAPSRHAPSLTLTARLRL